MAEWKSKIAALISGGADSLGDIQDAQTRGQSKAINLLNMQMKINSMQEARKKTAFDQQLKLIQLKEKGYSVDDQGNIFKSEEPKQKPLTTTAELKSLESFLSPSTSQGVRDLRSASPEQVDTANLRRREILNLPNAPSDIFVSGREGEGVLKGVRNVDALMNPYKLDPSFDKLDKKTVLNSLSEMTKQLFDQDFLKSNDKDVVEAKAALAAGVSPSIVRRELANALRIKKQNQPKSGMFK